MEEQFRNSGTQNPYYVQYKKLKLTKNTRPETLDDKTVTVFDSAKGLSFESIIFNSEEARNFFSEQVEVLIFVAMYNEEPKELETTLNSLVDNISDFPDLTRNEIGVVVIVDGYYPFTKNFTKEHQEFYQRFYDDELVRANLSYDEKVISHENFKKEKKTESFNTDHEYSHCFFSYYYKDEGPNNYIKLAFCIKEKNKRKINSHLWFLGGFCKVYNPKYCFLLDVGTKPLKKAIYYLYEAMEKRPEIAGCCGEIKPSFNVDFKPYLNPVFMGQVVEYKMSHVFDKSLENVLGFVTVLPGAFCAYRWSQLDTEILWEEYFKSICRPWEMDCFNSNIFLAEDRVLCYSLICKDKNILKYIKNSVAETFVPSTLAELLVQRRRWINGSWFALIHAMKNFNHFFHGDHSWLRKLGFVFMVFYQLLNIFYSWVMVGSFFVVFAITVKKTVPYGVEGSWKLGNVIVNLYVGMLMCVLIFSLTTAPSRIQRFFQVVSILFGLYMVVALFFIVMFALEGYTWVLVLVTATAFCLGALLCLNRSKDWAFWTVLKGLFHFILMTPTYVNVFMVYSICNIHDCSWGTRPDKMKEEETKKKQEFEAFRGRWVLIWLVSNVVFGYHLNSIDNEEHSTGNDENYVYVYAVGIAGISILIIRFIGGVVFLLGECFTPKTAKKTEDPASTLQP